MTQLANELQQARCWYNIKRDYSKFYPAGFSGSRLFFFKLFYYFIQEIDFEVRKILREATERTKQIILEHKTHVEKYKNLSIDGEDE